MSAGYRYLFISFLLLFSHSSWAVFGGVETSPTMQKSLVYLLFEKGACTGVLIEKNIVLTAAHCMDFLGKPEKATVIADDPSLKKCSSSKVINYEYTPNAKPILPRNAHAPDLLMVQLETNICSGQAARVMDKPLVPGDVFSLAGYGGGSGLWYKSRQIDLEIIPEEGIEDLNSSQSPIFKDLLSLSPEFYSYALPLVSNTTSCTGDSGGPLFINNNGQMDLYAINGAAFPNSDLGADKCNRGYLNLITPLAPYYDWIQEKIEAWSL